MNKQEFTKTAIKIMVKKYNKIAPKEDRLNDDFSDFEKWKMKYKGKRGLKWIK